MVGLPLVDEVAAHDETASFDAMMNRRRCIGAMAGLCCPCGLPPRRLKRETYPPIGLLLFNSPRSEPIGPLLQGLDAMGYVDGKTLAIEYRFAEGDPERLPDLAAQLVQLKPDVIFAFGGDVVPFAIKATTSIPIVAWMSNDPVESGMVTSLGRPRGNVTGVTLVYDELAGKTLGFLKEAAPAAFPRSSFVEPGSCRSGISRDQARSRDSRRAATVPRGTSPRRFRRSVQSGIG
jgi:putative ABC transport system substrate-binding protein